MHDTIQSLPIRILFTKSSIACDSDYVQLYDKLSILDVKATDVAGAVFNIEMQLSVTAGLVKRLVFYGCELFVGQLSQGQDYTKLNPV